MSSASNAAKLAASQAFKNEFLGSYLRFGLGSMSKSDADALVMYLLDRYGSGDDEPLAGYSNQAVSERLRTPVSRIKKLRYEAALRFGGDVHEQAKARLLAALWNASLEPQDDKICLIIEDSLAKNWLQGQLKTSAQIFDHSFNTEIIRVSAAGLFSVLEQLFPGQDIKAFRREFDNSKKKQDNAARIAIFKNLTQDFARGAATAAGASVVSIVRSFVPL